MWYYKDLVSKQIYQCVYKYFDTSGWHLVYYMFCHYRISAQFNQQWWIIMPLLLAAKCVALSRDWGDAHDAGPCIIVRKCISRSIGVFIKLNVKNACRIHINKVMVRIKSSFRFKKHLIYITLPAGLIDIGTPLTFSDYGQKSMNTTAVNQTAQPMITETNEGSGASSVYLSMGYNNRIDHHKYDRLSDNSVQISNYVMENSSSIPK